MHKPQVATSQRTHFAIQR